MSRSTARYSAARVSSVIVGCRSNTRISGGAPICRRRPMHPVVLRPLAPWPYVVCSIVLQTHHVDPARSLLAIPEEGRRGAAPASPGKGCDAPKPLLFPLEDDSEPPRLPRPSGMLRDRSVPLASSLPRQCSLTRRPRLNDLGRRSPCCPCRRRDTPDSNEDLSSSSITRYRTLVPTHGSVVRRTLG